MEKVKETLNKSLVNNDIYISNIIIKYLGGICGVCEKLNDTRNYYIKEFVEDGTDEWKIVKMCICCSSNFRKFNNNAILTLSEFKWYVRGYEPPNWNFMREIEVTMDDIIESVTNVVIE